MLSYRDHIRQGLCIPIGTPVSWRNSFSSRPHSLRQAMRAMLSPGSFTEVDEGHRRQYWTDECQGVACDGVYWYFTSNSHKTLEVFRLGDNLEEDHGFCPALGFRSFVPGLDHIGQITYHDGYLYVSHYSDGPSQVIVLQFDGNQFHLVRIVQVLEQIHTSPSTGASIARLEFQDLNPWDGLLYTCGGCMDGQPVYEFFKHDPETGLFKRRADNGEPDTLRLSSPIFNVQGACFSPNGHLYVSEDIRMPFNDNLKRVSYFSALNGHKYGEFYVVAEEKGYYPDEMEGLCYADLSWPDGRRAQIHLVLLENCMEGDDGIYFKWYCAENPDLV